MRAPTQVGEVRASVHGELQSMRLVAWNVMKGGRRRAAPIAATLRALDPDVVVLTEVNERSGPVLDALQAAGWAADPALIGVGRPKCGAAALLSRLPLIVHAPARVEAAFPGRWVEAEVPGAAMRIIGIYGPLKNEDFNAFWQVAREALSQRAHEAVVMAGDLNTGESLLDAPGRNFFCSRHFAAVKGIGYVDAWRHVNGAAREFSYWSPQRRDTAPQGYRLDHALVSPTLVRRLRGAHYAHDVRTRKDSDHAPLVVDFG